MTELQAWILIALAFLHMLFSPSYHNTREIVSAIASLVMEIRKEREKPPARARD